MTRKWRRFAQFAQTGDWQLHTSITDGRSSPLEYREQAEAAGIPFLLFSEHVRREMTYDYRQFADQIRESFKTSAVTAVSGAETKVLDTSGLLDINQSVGSDAEIVLFAFHSHYFKTTEDYFTAIPLVDIWAHPTSYESETQLMLSAVQWSQIFELMKREDVCFEINKRYPLPSPEVIKLLIHYKVPIVFGSDAHDAQELLTPEDIAKFSKLVRS
jgi:putative hydrolase